MEAKWLFDVDLDHIQVVGTAKEYHSFDGRICRWCGDGTARYTGHETADPVCTVLSTQKVSSGRTLDFKTLTEITFEEPDMETFLGLPMAMEASRRGGSMPTVFNAANERAVAKFLHGQIGFWIFTEASGRPWIVTR